LRLPDISFSAARYVAGSCWFGCAVRLHRRVLRLYLLWLPFTLVAVLYSTAKPVTDAASFFAFWTLR